MEGEEWECPKKLSTPRLNSLLCHSLPPSPSLPSSLLPQNRHLHILRIKERKAPGTAVARALRRVRGVVHRCAKWFQVRLSVLLISSFLLLFHCVLSLSSPLITPSAPHHLPSLHIYYFLSPPDLLVSLL